MVRPRQSRRFQGIHLPTHSQLEATSQAEREDVQRLRARLEHLTALGAPSRGQYVEWNRRRLDRLLVDHLLRCGYHSTAVKLIETARVQVRRGGWQRWVSGVGTQV